MQAATTVPAGLWHNREYVRYRAGRVVSVLGSQLSGLALPLLVLGLGGSAVQVGLLASGALAAKLGSQLPAGYLADRFGRRGLMITSDLVRMLTCGSIPLAAAVGRPAYPQLLAVAVIDGAGAAVFSAAATAMLRDLVPPEQLTRAVSQTRATGGVMALIGPVLGGLCFAAARMLPFTLDACSYLLSAVLVASLARRPPAPGRAGGSQQDAGGRMSAGLRWIWRQPRVVRIVAFGGALNLAAAAAQVAAVVGLRERGTSAAVIGIVLACTGSGLVVGATVARRIIARLGAVRLCLVYGAGWTVGLMACAAWPCAPVVGPVLALLYFLAPASGIVLAQVTLGQAPSWLLGRVTTATQILSGGLAATGPAAAGLCLHALGISPLWVLLAALCLVATAVTMAPLALNARTAARSGGNAPPRSREAQA